MITAGYLRVIKLLSRSASRDSSLKSSDFKFTNEGFVGQRRLKNLLLISHVYQDTLHLPVKPTLALHLQDSCPVILLVVQFSTSPLHGSLNMSSVLVFKHSTMKYDMLQFLQFDTLKITLALSLMVINKSGVVLIELSHSTESYSYPAELRREISQEVQA